MIPDKIYDMIVIGGGPGGYTAALYGARAGLETLVLERLSAGGQMAETRQIDNYPGFPEGVDGLTLGMTMQAQAERFGVTTRLTEVVGVQLTERIKTVETYDGTFLGKTVVIATGAGHKHLGIEDEEALIGRGVGYCAACDGMFYRGKTVAVVGGGNSAAADALLLSRIAKKVYVIHRRDSLRATKVYHQPLMEAENVEFLWNSTVEKLLYEQKLTGVTVKNVQSGELSQLSLDGLFISIGRVPATELFGGQLALDEAGYIVADETTKTSLPGVFAVGDVRTKPVRQVVTAVGDGAVAAHYAEEVINAL
jgi:thioredoxin reductase (NADPH)